MDVRGKVLAVAPEAPNRLLECLERLAADLSAAAGPNLLALVLYGGLARGSYRPGQSDINVAVVLESAAPAALEFLAPALQVAWRAARVEPWIIARAELPRLAALFPSKILDLEARHAVLFGADPFHGLAAPDDRIRFRAEQALSNLGLRLRRRLIGSAGDPDAQARWVSEVARPLAAELAPLLSLAGAHPGSEDTADLLAAAAKAFALDGATLAELAAARKAPRQVADPAALLRRALTAVEAAASAARRGGP